MKGSIALIVVGFLIGTILMGLSANTVMREYRSKAIQLGVAEWVVDQKTGRTTFTWKEKP